MICTWTFPKRVWLTEPAKVPPFPAPAAEVVVSVEPVDPVVPLPEAAPEVLVPELLPDPLPVAADAPVDPVVPAEVPMDEPAASVTWLPDCHPTRRIPAEARVAETAARILTSQTFRSEAVLPARLLLVRL
ncbi:hypothetical protein GCM10009825_31440 [Arthrobacter humicola]|uniref:Uncharacterized protein n=1 Tax=Arthrobacter humicola TaxID=409291 RepID=A0ABP5L7S8_9MICC